MTFIWSLSKLFDSWRSILTLAVQKANQSQSSVAATSFDMHGKDYTLPYRCSLIACPSATGTGQQTPSRQGKFAENVLHVLETIAFVQAHCDDTHFSCTKQTQRAEQNQSFLKRTELGLRNE